MGLWVDGWFGCESGSVSGWAGEWVCVRVGGCVGGVWRGVTWRLQRVEKEWGMPVSMLFDTSITRNFNCVCIHVCVCLCVWKGGEGVPSM